MNKAPDILTDLLPLKHKLFRLALRVTQNREEAEDVVEDVLVKAWESRATWDELQSLEAYCLTMCRNLALDRIALHERRNASLDTSHLQTPDPVRSPHECLEQEERLRVVRAIIDQLPEKQRTVIHLRDMEGKSTAEVATLLDMTEANVKVLLHRARQFIKKTYLKIENYGL